MSNASKPRQPRLRASCDGCFLAKVKCSKARPICSRCLACGIECQYSPSTRIGKPKSDHSSSASDMSGLSPTGEEKAMMYTTHVNAPDLYRIETGWSTPPTAMDGTMSRNHSISSGLSLLGVEERVAREAEAVATVGNANLYGAGMPWTPPSDMSSAPFADVPPMAAPMPLGHGRSQSYDFSSMSAGVSPWADHATPHEMFGYGGGHTTQMPTPNSMTTFFPSPSSTPTLRPQPRVKAASMGTINGGGGGGGSGSCTCFTVCLQSLQALHNASSPASPPFDLVLSLNRKAVEGCAAMLGCTRCMSRSGTHTAAMLLATVIGKITSFYKNASQTYFFENGAAGATGASMTQAQGNSNIPTSNSNGNSSGSSPTPLGGLGVTIGVYQLNGEDGRWLEIEILARELRKLEELYSRFREVLADLSEDPEISRAMIGYLGQTLGSTLEVISHRKDMTFA